jgi:hypothetical protein
MKTLAEIIKTLESVDFPQGCAMVYVGKNYSKLDLINDLKELNKHEKENHERYEDFDKNGFDTSGQAAGNSYG